MKKLLFSIFTLSLMMVFPQSYATDMTVAPTNERQAPTLDQLEKQAPAIDATKTPATHMKTAPQNTSRDNEMLEEQPRQPCEGVPPTMTVEPQVQKFLDCKIINILAQPEPVKSFTVDFNEDSSLPERNRLGAYPIKEQGRNLTAEEIKDLQKLLFTDKSYHFGMEKRCRFRPDMGLHFVKGNEAVAILLSFSCNLWLFVDQQENKLEDFDPVEKELVKLGNSLFSAQ